MSGKATLVVTATPNPNEMPSVQEYLQGVMPLLLSAGGQLVKRLKVDQVINGNPSGMVLVMDFDSADSITSGAIHSNATGCPIRNRPFHWLRRKR